MAKFLVKYPSGTTQEVEASDCDTVEAYCNSHFGTTWASAQEHGATVEIVGAQEEEQDRQFEPQMEMLVDDKARMEAEEEEARKQNSGV